MRLERVFVTIGVLLGLFGSIAKANAQECCIEPSLEASSNKGPATLHVPNGATVTMFQQTIADGYGHIFNGDQLTEASGYAGTNGCWYAGAPFGQTSTVSGGNWYVAKNDIKNLGVTNSTNQWGIDLDGDTTDLVTLIRSHAVLPCTDHIPQTMYILVYGCISYPYYSNVQTVTISSTQVVNCRGGACDTITY